MLLNSLETTLVLVGTCHDHKHGWSFNSKTKQYQVWRQLEKLVDHKSLTKFLEVLGLQVLP